MSVVSPLIRESLKPLERYLAIDGLVELCINQPEEVLLETRDGWTRKKDPALTAKRLKNLAHVLATDSGQEFGDQVPLLACHLPGYGFRVQVVGGTLVESGIALSIRVGTARVFPMESYMSAEDAVRLSEAVVAGKTILVAGGTSSGKTTFLNSLIRLIPDDVRLVIVEDTKELVVPHENHLRLLKSKTGTDIAGITYKDIINACMRLRPDRILMGELDIDNTVPFLRLINTGHAGSMSTVHADSPRDALRAIAQNARLAGLTGPVEDYAEQSLDVVVHLKRISRTNISASLEFLR